MHEGDEWEHCILHIYYIDTIHSVLVEHILSAFCKRKKKRLVGRENAITDNGGLTRITTRKGVVTNAT